MRRTYMSRLTSGRVVGIEGKDRRGGVSDE